MLAKFATWLPTLVLAALFVFAAAAGLGVESVVVLGLVVLQILVLVVPRVARWVGRKVRDRRTPS